MCYFNILIPYMILLKRFLRHLQIIMKDILYRERIYFIKNKHFSIL